MAYKRILTIQDISCVGQCSMTVALPILSACGHETCILPTALLSTHTGGFGRPEVVHLDAAADKMWRHWQDNGITFDAVLVGYLGSVGAVETAGEILDTMVAPGGVKLVDPAMADHGKRYSGFDETYARAIAGLCRKADVLIPNVTEAAMLAGMEYREELDEGYVRNLLDGLDYPNVVLTGVGYQEDQTGVVVRSGENWFHHTHPKQEKSYHGTGDILAACLTGALLRGKTLEESAVIAANFTCRCIQETARNPAHWYGVKFEPVLPELMHLLNT